MSLTPLQVYSQSADKQRIILVGTARTRIYRLIHHVLNTYQRKFDYVLDNESSLGNGPVVLLDASQITPSLADLHHHILLITSLKGVSPDEIAALQLLADKTPKGGIIIYNETDSKTKEIGEKERADVTLIPYKTYAHKKEGSQTILVTSTNEKVPIKLSSEEDLQNISGARELLKRIGISSGQFYRAVADFES
jgi:UDP-N-acetylmuramate: L-alanyl-gamma-D-glutamyl-meso-diaminopimelate ligase